ncbi:NAD(P)H-dependent oxidoreductase [Flagellimonas alvinocaridis]|uniref:NAD(P)H-dependent oxidoreductase n=1 Tax=Flagellimonas alvinocaridis TaxID=2530200 RepID=A0A4S8RJ94_9FLAO|nr:NAD(P)H-dependent oxidoreductase [Allomuricauda alvinocaridis]THV56845.1 NAD(P)H-dependent oxidoreductase [Allomuricauda alvinocaridis]
MELLEHLKWRYATKTFDSTRKVTEEDMHKLKEAIQLSVSSYGLQLYKVLVISNQKLKEELKIASWNQDQITDASHLFVFCNYTERKEEDVDAYIQSISQIQATPMDKLEGYGNLIKRSLIEMDETTWMSWSEKQTYLAMSTLLMACAELRIDACPMEGYEVEKYNKILGLDEQGLNASVIVPVGYRSKEDHTQFRKKVRKPLDELFEIL